MPHRALITGLPGFAGGFLAEHLLDCGDAVLGCSPDGGWEANSPVDLQGQVELIAWDLGEELGPAAKSRRRIVDFRPDWIFHLAGLSVPDDCGREEPTARAIAVNVDGTRRVLELAASMSPQPRVLLISSSHVYAPVGAEAAVVDESSPLGPVRGYGHTKLAAEAQAHRAADQAGCDVVIARSFQHTGPRQNGRMMLPQWTRQFTRGGSEPVQVYTRDAHIDLTDVRDVVRAYRLLLQHGRTAAAYNVGSGVSVRSGEVLRLLHEMADPHRAITESHPGRRQDPIANITRLVQCTGWQAEIELERTVADTLAWWQQQ